MSAMELLSAADLGALANELEHNERLHAIDGRDSYPVDWVSKFQIRPDAVYVEALRIAARAVDREALGQAFAACASDNEHVAAIQSYLLGR